MVKGKSATVTAPSDAQNDGSQSTATFFAPPVNHMYRSDFVGVSIGFTPPTYLEDEDEAYDSMSNAVNSEMDAFPNIILLPFASRQSLPLHIRAPSWSRLCRLLAQSSTSRLESTSRKYLKLRTVIQFTNLTRYGSRETILWFTIDQPVPPNIPDGVQYNSSNPNILPWSYTQSPIPALLARPGYFKPYTIPATDKLPYPTLPITFPDLALYLQAALEESKHIRDDKLGEIMLKY